MPNNLTAFDPDIWSTRLIPKVRQVNVGMAVCANTDYEGDIKSAGATVQVRTVGRITTQKYAKGQTINYETLAPTKEPMVISDSDMFAFNVDDVDVAQSDIEIYDAYTAEAAIAMNELIDTKIFSFTKDANSANAITSSGSAISVSSVGAGTAIYELLVQAGLNLNNFNVPQEGRWAIITPFMASLLAKDTKYLIRSTELGDSVVRSAANGMTAQTAPNYIGKLAGFDLYWSNNLPIQAGTGSSATYFTPYGQGRPISYAAQLQKVERLRLESTFATAVRGLILHDGKVFAEYAKKLGYIFVTNS